MQIKFISLGQAGRPSLLRKAGMVAVALALGAAILTFAALLLPVVVLGAAYFWWRTREVRKQFRQMQEQMRQMQAAAAQGADPRREAFEGEIIEGEVIRVQVPGKGE